MTKRDFIWLAYPDNVCEKSRSGVFGCPTLYGLSEDCNAYSNCEDWTKDSVQVVYMTEIIHSHLLISRIEHMKTAKITYLIC